MASHSASSESIGVSGMMAALFTRTSMRPCQAMASATAAGPSPLGEIGVQQYFAVRLDGRRRMLDTRQVAGIVGDE